MAIAGAIQAGVQQGGANMSQYAQRYALYDQADQAEGSIQDVDLQAAQMGEERAIKLSQALAAIESRRAASGLDLDSPTGVAIERQMMADSQRSGQIEKATSSQQRLSLLAKARSLREAGYQAGRLMDIKHDFSLADNISGGAVRKGWGYKG